MSNRPKIVVLTPVRNEAWILRRFLAVSSAFADQIIVADQHSTDESRDICRGFPKVWLIENAATEYNEWARQKLLIEEARRRVPSPRILLALDADEILAADGPTLAGVTSVDVHFRGTVLGSDEIMAMEFPDAPVDQLTGDLVLVAPGALNRSLPPLDIEVRLTVHAPGGSHEAGPYRFS